MEPMKILKFNAANPPTEEYFLSPEKLISGNPKQTVWQHYTDPSGKFLTGIWQSDIGKWRISYTEEEYCQILEGISILTDEHGNAVTVTSGENFVIPRGFVGTWEVVERTRKIYVIYEAGT
jgi:uncharacterized cupin superfamily protein